MALQRTRTSRVLEWALWAATLALGACSVLQRFGFTPPAVALEKVTVTAVSLSGGSLTLHFDVHNPNPYELHGTEFSADVELEGTPFGRVSHSEPFALPSAQHSRVDVDLQFTWAGIGTAARGIIDRGAVTYGLRGRFLVDTPIDQRWVEVGTTGEADLVKLLR